MDYSADNYNKIAPFVYSDEYTAPILKWLNPSQGQRIIDLGCGSGDLTVKLQDAVGAGGFVLGVDYNQDMLTKAAQNGLKNLFHCDIQDMKLSANLCGENLFDAVFSNATLHWCKRDPSGVLEGIKRVLKDGGRFVCEMGGHLNCVGVRACLHHVVRTRGVDPESIDPWYFPSVEEYRKLLENAGFRVDTISLVPRITMLKEGGLRDWLQLFARDTFLKTFDDEGAAAIMDEAVRMCGVDCQDKDGNWSMMYARLRFSATLVRD